MRIANLHSCAFLVALFTITASTNLVAAQNCKDEGQFPSSTPIERFVDNADGTIIDTTTNLVWKKCSEGLILNDCSVGIPTSVDWQGALQIAETSDFDGSSDWRLPNIKELSSIIEERCSSPAINLTVFPNTPSSSFWSSTPDVFDPSRAWFIIFSDGNSGSNFRTVSKYLRLVRTRN